MTEQLGEIERPSAEEFKEERKLFFVPLILAPRGVEGELREVIERYWDQVLSQVEKLEMKLGQVMRVYHELIPVGGEEAGKAIAELSAESHRLVKSKVDKGAELHAMEDGDLLTELMDWTRCLGIGLQNERVWNTVYQSFVEVQKRRNEHISRQIDETLKGGETAVLLMREGHQVQFPTDIKVFYVAPPALDEMRRWLREHETYARGEEGRGAEAETGSEEDAESEGAT